MTDEKTETLNKMLKATQVGQCRAKTEPGKSSKDGKKKKRLLGSKAAGGTAPLGVIYSKVNIQAASAGAALIALSHVYWQLTKTRK